MPQLFLRFAIDLARSDLPSFRQSHGPLFHRWLPDGENASITLPTGTPNAELVVWFHRAGRLIDSFVEFQQGESFDEALIPTQGVLDAGPLWGRMVLKNVRKKDIEALQEPTGTSPYLALGKTIVHILVPPLSAFVDTLRLKYGQYWLSPILDWDSRRQSLGSYCQGLGLRWSADGTSWAPFLPDQPVIQLSGSLTSPESFLAYLTEADWNAIDAQSSRDYAPPFGATVLLRARELLDNDNLRHALIEATTATEVTVDQLIRDRMAASPLSKHRDRLLELPLPLKLAFLAVHEPRLTNDDVIRALKAIDYRNQIVHEGKQPRADWRPALKALIQVTARLSSYIVKLPSAQAGNACMSPDAWQREQADREPPFLV